jgi:hypothetical protein
MRALVSAVRGASPGELGFLTRRRRIATPQLDDLDVAFLEDHARDRTFENVDVRARALCQRRRIGLQRGHAYGGQYDSEEKQVDAAAHGVCRGALEDGPV